MQVNVNPAYRAHELAYVLKKSGMKALILRTQDTRSHYKQTRIASDPEVALQHFIYLGEESWDQMTYEQVLDIAYDGPSDAMP